MVVAGGEEDRVALGAEFVALLSAVNSVDFGLGFSEWRVRGDEEDVGA